MSIVSPSDFVGEITIAQVEQPENAASVNQYILKYEAKYLLEVLGYTLYTAYAAGITAGDAVYIALRDGGTYVDYHGDTIKYEGMKEAIANFVYFHYITNNATFTTGSGEKEIHKSIAVSSMDKQIKAWNVMVEINRKLRVFIRLNAVYGAVSYAENKMFFYLNNLGI